jgi:hypothetical protein
MTTDKRIAITKASDQLGVTEAMLRDVIKPLYPDSWETIKSIKLSQFTSVAEALKDMLEAEMHEIEMSEEFADNTSETDETDAQELEPEALEGNSNITVAEPDDLTTQETQQLKVSVVQTFSDTAIDLNRITSAMAYSAALQNFASFQEIHSATFRHYVDQYVNEFGDEYQQMLNDLEVQCNPKDFLKERGIITA